MRATAMDGYGENQLGAAPADDAALGPLRDLARAAHNPALADVHGMVYQVWHDGEVTLQKCGELLWRRNIHQHRPPHRGFALAMPAAHNAPSGASYAFVTGEDAYELHRLMGLAAAGEPGESVAAQARAHLARVAARDLGPGGRAPPAAENAGATPRPMERD